MTFPNEKYSSRVVGRQLSAVFVIIRKSTDQQTIVSLTGSKPPTGAVTGLSRFYPLEEK